MNLDDPKKISIFHLDFYGKLQEDDVGCFYIKTGTAVIRS